MNTQPCWMCGNQTGNTGILLRELMYGSREPFEYLQCASCSSLFIAAVPPDLSRHYPADYYSFCAQTPAPPSSALKHFLRGKRSEYLAFGKGLIGRLMMYPGAEDWFSEAYSWDWFKTTSTRPGSRILDVGCGAGILLFTLREQGFCKLTGIDPFLREPVEAKYVTLVSRTVHDVSGEFDFVMAHHSLEHMPDPEAALVRMRNLCRAGGWLLLRSPVLGESWNCYREHWVELDAPRHLFIPSMDGLCRLVERIGGLEVKKVVYESSLLEIAGSELYARNIPLRGPTPDRSVEYNDFFSKDELQCFKTRTDKLAADGCSGRAAIYLQKTT